MKFSRFSNVMVYRLAQKPISFLRNKLSDRQFFILSSILVGITSGLAAVLLKYVVHILVSVINFYSILHDEFLVIALLPLFGILLTVFFMHFFLKEKLKKGSAEIVYAIAKKSSVIPPKEMYAHLITSALTVGFGGSVGLESPMVSTGSAIGSNYGSTYRLSYKERTILLGCGAAAGIAAAFNSPIAGVLFAVEVLLTDISVAAFIPLIISAACGALLSKMILGEGVLLSFFLQQPFNYANVPYYIVMGILAGLVSIYYARVFTWTENRITIIKNKWMRAIIGGLVLFALMILFPPLFGEGYETIKTLSNIRPQDLVQTSILKEFLNNEGYLLIFLTLLMLLKSFAAAITLGSGGNGGNFAPSLFVGSYLGFIFSRLINLSGISQIPESNFTIVAMAGILSGVFYAPLTAIFLIAEITGGYELMIPLMIVSSLSVMIVHFVEPLSMEAKKLSAKLNVSIENRDRFLLSKLDLTELIETNFSVVHPEETLPILIKTISKASRNLFPVIDDEQRLIGIVHMNHIRDIIFDPVNHENITVKELMTPPAVTIERDESLHSVLQKFEDTRQWNLPVTDQNRYIGFLSKSSILARYRNELLESA
jgi:chloride channel protein, CIC family